MRLVGASSLVDHVVCYERFINDLIRLYSCRNKHMKYACVRSTMNKYSNAVARSRTAPARSFVAIVVGLLTSLEE